jgi:hypothetical protein
MDNRRITVAELQESNATIVPVPKELGMAQGDMGRYQLGIKEYDAAGRATEFAISLSMDDPKWGPRIQTAAILKQSPQWKAAAFPYIIYAVMYAENLGLDVMAGDVFDVGGRLATSNKAKIKRALASGNIEGIETTTVELDAPGPDKCVAKKDLECTVTVHVKGWKHPIVRRARLSRWYKGSNPNWRDNPEHMLEMNTTAHACEYVVPGGTEGDEAPPPVWQTATAATMENDLVPALKASILQVNQLKGKP